MSQPLASFLRRVPKTLLMIVVAGCTGGSQNASIPRQSNAFLSSETAASNALGGWTDQKAISILPPAFQGDGTAIRAAVGSGPSVKPNDLANMLLKGDPAIFDRTNHQIPTGLNTDVRSYIQEQIDNFKAQGEELRKHENVMAALPTQYLTDANAFAEPFPSPSPGVSPSPIPGAPTCDPNAPKLDTVDPRANGGADLAQAVRGNFCAAQNNGKCPVVCAYAAAWASVSVCAWAKAFACASAVCKSGEAVTVCAWAQSSACAYASAYAFFIACAGG